MKQIFYGLVYTTLFTLLACSSNKDDCQEGQIEFPNAVELYNGEEYRQSLIDCRLPKVQTFVFMAFQGAEIVSEQGTILHIDPLSFTDSNGNIIDGEITVSLLEFYDQETLIACQLSTNALNPINSIEPTNSIGVFYIEITFNGQPVIINSPILLFVPSQTNGLQLSNFNSPSCQEMLCEVLWEQQPNIEVTEQPYITTSGEEIQGYQTIIQSPKSWYSLAQFSTTPNKTTVYNKAPAGYDTSNSRVFIIYNQPLITVGLFTEFDEDNKVFAEIYQQIPRDITAKIIFVSKQNGVFVYGTNTTTITPNLVTTTLTTNTADTEESFISQISNQ
jgi:hypothetical protein